MKLYRPRLTAARIPVAAAAAAAVLTMAALAGPASASARNARQQAGRHSAAARPALVDCAGKNVIRPSSFILACADANSVLQKLSWPSWASSAYGTGTWRVNDCTPNCAAGKFHTFPALVVAWRPRALSHGRAARHYTRLTMILPGVRCYTAQHKRSCYPATATMDLWEPPSKG